MKSKLLSPKTLLICFSAILCHLGAATSETAPLDDQFEAAYQELLEMEKDIDPSIIPKVNPMLPKIKKLRERHEQGKLPKDTDAFLTMEQVCHKYGFAYEEHHITTEDGYIMLVGRIPGLKDENLEIPEGGSSKPAIILQHGMGINMMQWILNTPETTQAFVLARAGYDVWMGNNRGTQFSQGHVSLNAKKDRKYWDFTWEDMGTKDQVAQINYILKLTKREKVSYMGHSEGTTQIMAGGSLLPEYFNSKINVAILLAPPSAMLNSPNELFRFLSSPKLMPFLSKAAETLNFLDWIPYNLFISDVASKFCALLDGKLCEIVYAIAEGNKVAGVDRMDRDDVYLSYLPTDTGAFNFEHYGQLYRTKSGQPEFKRFDYGKDGNMKKYNQSEPPQYNLKNLGFPIAIFHGTYDDLADPKDVAWLYEHIKDHVIHYEELPFGHLSFQIAKDMSYFTKTAMPIINKYNNIGQSEELQSNATKAPESDSLVGVLI